MKRLFILPIFILLFALAACGEETTETAQPPAATQPAELPPPQVVTEPVAATPAVAPTTVPAATPMPESAEEELPPALAPEDLAGTYRFRPDETREEANYFLLLNADGTAEIDEQLAGSDELNVEGRGNWTLIDERVVINVTEFRGQPPSQEAYVAIDFVDGFPVITDIKVGDQLIHLENTGFNLGAGESDPIIRELNERLAAVDFLNYTDPGSDLYTETVRQAVVAFQESQGLWPDGVLNAETWFALENPQPPLPTPTPLPPPAEPITGVPDLNQLPATTEDGQPILYLTFDDGPLPDHTPAILDVLDEHEAVATFFNLGQNVATWPDLVREATIRGHYIANHTWDHANLEGITQEQFVSEVERTSDAIFAAAGDLFNLDLNVRYVRPPYGATDANTRQYAANEGMAVVLWTIDTQDWRQPGAEIIAEYLLSSAYPGAIVLMHDGGGDRTQTAEALSLALPQLREQGYVFRNIFLP